MGIASSVTALAGQVRRRYRTTDRVAEYARVLRTARDAGFDLVSLAELDARCAAADELAADEPAAGAPGAGAPGAGTPGAGTPGADRGRIIALRHDVDIPDPAGNAAFHAAELEVGARSTFYFRRSTVGAHATLIRRLLDDGFEVGYHYEEGATIAKRHALANRAAVEARREEVAELLQANCEAFRERWNPGLVSIASHGDWMNRRLGFANHELVTPELLDRCGLRFEAYGDRILGRVDLYVSDVATPPEAWAAGGGLTAAIEAGHTRICVLTHERRWHPDLRAGLAADGDRLADELKYRARRARKRAGPPVAVPDTDPARPTR